MLACGVDTVEIGRVEGALARFGARFLDRVFTPAEQAHCAGRAASLAARWAAKEAVSKALGCGIGDVGWREIEVVAGPRGAPALQLHGGAARLAAEQGLRQWAVSVSHDGGLAIAFVVATG